MFLGFKQVTGSLGHGKSWKGLLFWGSNRVLLAYVAAGKAIMGNPNMRAS